MFAQLAHPDQAARCILVNAGVGGINAFQVVIIYGGLSIPADGSNATHAGRVVGIAPAPIAEGAEGDIQVIGELENPAWNFTPGAIQFVGAAGTISETPPATGFCQKIGVAKNATVLVIDLQVAVKVI